MVVVVVVVGVGARVVRGEGVTGWECGGDHLAGVCT